MGNPLHKRLPKEFLGDIGKYLVIFLFMAATIGFVSGFLVADDSMIEAYNESFDKYNIEDGNFELASPAEDNLIEHLEDEGLRTYKNYYIEEHCDNESTLRIFINRSQIDKVCLMKGSFPANTDEIAIDRMYADNNEVNVGDIIKTDKKTLKVTGFVALSDYSALFSDNGDMMFDAMKFGVGVMTEEGFNDFNEDHIHYNYSWKYDDAPADDSEAKEKSEDFLKVLGTSAAVINYIPEYANQAIHFTGNDMGSDKSMMITLLYILIAILAFVFAVTTNHTITREAPVIGTLRASGYTRGELLGHYLSIPLIVTLVAAIVGNILGYTIFKDICATMYYGSYSLPTYETLWNSEAFILTTIIPLIIMMIINVVMIYRKLTLSPLKFIRRDINRLSKKKAMRLPRFKFLSRFRLRIILQNMPGYFTLFIGIVFANILLLFGMMVSPLLTHYQQETVDHMIADYQYVLKAPVSTASVQAERYSMEALRTIAGKYESEDVSVYGIIPDSKYINAEMPSEGVFVSEGYAEKYGLKIGDIITLKDTYGDEKYEFKVKGLFNYPAAISIFMSIDEFRDVFDKDKDYYNGYFSNKELNDIDNKAILSKITEDDLTKVSRQLDISMGKMFMMINVFAVVLFALLIYLLTKLIIERNASSISMVKILGYTNGEISRLYLLATTWIVVISTLLSLVIATVFIKAIYSNIMAEFHGWITFYVEPAKYPEMFFMGMGAYLVVAILQFRKIKRIPMDEALKNVE